MARNYVLAPFSELRIVTDDYYDNTQPPPTIKLLNTKADVTDLIPNMRGAAEIYGRELIQDAEYTIDEGEKLAVFTWVGCSLQVKGKVLQEYQGADNAMKEYLNVINVLNAEREFASVKRIQGPRVLITGSPSSGKSSVSMLMCNYAVRSGWTPVFVEADPRASTDKKPLQFYPGTLGASVISAMTDEVPNNPLLYFYGYTDVQENEQLYIKVSQSMAATIEIMMEEALINQPNSRRSDVVNDMCKYVAASGMIINAPYFTNRDIIVKLAKMFNVSMILVIDSPSVHQELVRTFDTIRDAHKGGIYDEMMEPNMLGKLAFHDDSGIPSPNEADDTVAQEVQRDSAVRKEDVRDVIVLAVNKLEGVVPVDQERVKYLWFKIWRRYFDRPTNGEMHVIKFPMESVNLVTPESSRELSKDALPADDNGDFEKEEICASQWIGDPVSLTNSILGISSSEDIKLIPYCNLLGFFLVRAVEESTQPQEDDEENMGKDVTFNIEALCPIIYSPSALPPFLIVSGNQRSMKWQPNRLN